MNINTNLNNKAETSSVFTVFVLLCLVVHINTLANDNVANDLSSYPAAVISFYINSLMV